MYIILGATSFPRPSRGYQSHMTQQLVNPNSSFLTFLCLSKYHHKRLIPSLYCSFVIPWENPSKAIGRHTSSRDALDALPRYVEWMHGIVQIARDSIFNKIDCQFIKSIYQANNSQTRNYRAVRHITLPILTCITGTSFPVVPLFSNWTGSSISIPHIP